MFGSKKSYAQTSTTTSVSSVDQRTAGGSEGSYTAGPGSKIAIAGQDAAKVVASASDLIRVGLEGVQGFAENLLAKGLAAQEIVGTHQSRIARQAIQESGRATSQAVSSTTGAIDWVRIVGMLAIPAVIVVVVVVWGRS